MSLSEVFNPERRDGFWGEKDEDCLPERILEQSAGGSDNYTVNRSDSMNGW